jgi:hypothetical protein
MRLAGSPEAWLDLLDSMVPRILGLAIETWDALPRPGGAALEDPTTERLCRELRQNRDSIELPFRIDLQMAELDPAEGETQGRMDIVFSPLAPREDIYFCLECKRLNVVSPDGAVRPYASEYVTQGMFRFIRGRYAARVRQGGMLGYVLNGNIPQAIANVRRCIGQRRAELGMAEGDGLRPSSIMSGDDRVRETRHMRPHSAGHFCMHHIFASGT